MLTAEMCKMLVSYQNITGVKYPETIENILDVYDNILVQLYKDCRKTEIVVSFTDNPHSVNMEYCYRSDKDIDIYNDTIHHLKKLGFTISEEYIEEEKAKLVKVSW